MFFDSNIPEIILGMAFATERSEISMVNVVTVMTIYAAAFNFLIRRQWFVMTAMAVNLFMRAFDFKIGSVMIELPD
jgi:hypothetical protein